MGFAGIETESVRMSSSVTKTTGAKPAIKKITFNVIPDPTTRAVAFETGDIDLLYGNEGLLPLDTCPL